MRVAEVEREKKLVRVNELITVSELAQIIKVSPTEIVGFAFKNLEALLGGELPARLFVHETEGAARAHPPKGAGFDPVVLALGLLYLVLQTFLAGGILGVLRGSGVAPTLRGFLHGSAFYFGRMARIAILALAHEISKRTTARRHPQRHLLQRSGRGRLVCPLGNFQCLAETRR